MNENPTSEYPPPIWPPETKQAKCDVVNCKHEPMVYTQSGMRLCFNHYKENLELEYD